MVAIILPESQLPMIAITKSLSPFRGIHYNHATETVGLSQARSNLDALLRLVELATADQRLIVIETMKVPVLIFSLVGAAISLLAPLLNDYVPVAVCCGLLVCYAAVACRRVPKTPAGREFLSGVGDQLYFLGHLYTLSGLLGAAVSFGNSPESYSSSQRLLVFVVVLKLATSVVGLVGMLYLKARSEEASVDGPPVSSSPATIISVGDAERILFGANEADRETLNALRKSLIDRATELENQLHEFQKSIKAFEGGLAKAGRGVSQFQNSFTMTSEWLDKLARHAEGSCTILGNANTEMKTFFTNVRELKKVLDDFVRVLEMKIESA